MTNIQSTTQRDVYDGCFFLCVVFPALLSRPHGESISTSFLSQVVQGLSRASPLVRCLKSLHAVVASEVDVFDFLAGLQQRVEGTLEECVRAHSGGGGSRTGAGAGGPTFSGGGGGGGAAFGDASLRTGGAAGPQTDGSIAGPQKGHQQILEYAVEVLCI